MLVPVASVDDGLRWRVEQLRDQARALGWPSLDGGGDLYVPSGAEGFISFITYRVPYAACGQRWALRDLGRIELLLAEAQAEHDLQSATTDPADEGFDVAAARRSAAEPVTARA